MKIKCRYCNNFMNDTDDVCPSCGAHNDDVVRTTKSQPKTIEELQQWYADRGLPPYEVTRFFIGMNYQKPRAFGIYKDSSGKCVVYKNKDSGQRAIRYEGTDEAYAVNEIFQRLKQEIIEQKMNNVKKAGGSGSATRSYSAGSNYNGSRSASSGNNSTRSAGSVNNGTRTTGSNYTGTRSTGSGYSNTSYSGSGTSNKKRKSNKFLKILGLILSPFILLFVIAIIIVIVENNPNQGYYDYRGDTYYYSAEDYSQSDLNWYKYDEEWGWSYPIALSEMPETLRKNKTAKEYYLQYDWDDSLSCQDFEDSVYYADMRKGFKTSEGYYKYGEDDYYYHLGNDYNSGWYHYSDENDWTYEDSINVPEELFHPSVVEDFYYTPTWDASTQLTDFTDSTVYSDYLAEQATQRSYSYDDDNDSGYSWDDDDWGWDDDDDYDWDYGGSNSWDSGSTDWDSDW